MVDQNYKQSHIYIKWILDGICKIQTYTKNITREEFENNTMMSDACLMQLQHIWETIIQLYKINPDINISHKENIWWFRNLLSHQYRAVRISFIRKIINESLPNLKSEIDDLYKQYE